MRICEANTRILRAKPRSYIDAMSIGRLAPASTHQRIPQTAENRTLCRARALSKREAFVARGRGRRQAAEAGADLRSKYADSPRNAPAQFRCDVDRAPCPGLNPSTDLPNPRRIELCAGRGRKENAAATQSGTRFPNGGPGGKSIPEFVPRTGHAFRMPAQAESSSRNPASNWDALSAPSPQL